MIRRALAAAAATLALAAPAASADEQIAAGPGSQYLTTSVTIDQGERLTFQNVDTTGHDVTARLPGLDGKPLFGTPVIGTGGSAFVDGSQYLTTGDYDFLCSIHPFMTGTLHVTTGGKPVPRPARPDTRAPGVAVQIVSAKLGKVASSGKLQISFNTNEAATVGVSGSVKAGGKTFAIAKVTRQVQANRAIKLALALSTKAKDALKRASKATFKVSIATRDKAGNRGAGSAKRTLKR
ncbi:MAG TPA: plastocyanin/azurin family copper-binding protein [Thermoleophilaceae bacterium]|nr:plastocyanin/azurin family copper-binding protein [Thermoleophilaceae bacterium]